LSKNRVKQLVNENDLVIEKIPLGTYYTNSYLLSSPVTGESILIDAPGEPAFLKQKLNKTNLTRLLITHSHLDHIGALEEVKKEYGVPIGVHQKDASHLNINPDFFLFHGQCLQLGVQNIEVLHTPGHTPGSVSFKIKNYLIAGDTIFPGGPGKTNSPENFQQIIKTIRETIFSLPENTLIFPGHGDHTVLETEKKMFAQFEKQGYAPDLYGDVTWA